MKTIRSWRLATRLGYALCVVRLQKHKVREEHGFGKRLSVCPKSIRQTNYKQVLVYCLLVVYSVKPDRMDTKYP